MYMRCTVVLLNKKIQLMFNFNNSCFSDIEIFDINDQITINTPVDDCSILSDETLIYGYDCDSEENTFDDDDDDDISSGSDEISGESSKIQKSVSFCNFKFCSTKSQYE